MLGGSTMWGWTARDSATIPSLVAARLTARGEDVEVVSLAQPAFNLTQETITLLLELRRGNVPDVAVFLDGNNEIAPAIQAGSAGHILNEAQTAQALEFGRSGVWRTLLGLGRRSMLVERIGRATGPAPAAPPPNALCGDVVRYYRNLVRSVEGLGREFGFSALFLWQPMRATTQKPLTAWERSIPTTPGYRPTVLRCTALADSLMADRLGRSYFQLGSLFDVDTSSVFLDDYGHVTEAANAAIADRITELLEPILAQSSGAAASGEPRTPARRPRR
jgi:hypothetical protein